MKPYGQLKKALAVTLSVLLILTFLPARLLRVAAAEDDQTALYIDKGSITIGNGTVSGYDISGNSVTVPNPAGYLITQTDSGMSTPNTVTVTGGSVEITLKNVNMQIASTGFSPLISIASGASVDLTLSGTNSLINNNYNTGIQLPLGASLSILGNDEDTLNVTGGNESAAIGTSYYGIGGTAGTLNINGGKVIATGYDGAAGIGGGNNSKGGNVNITAGTVTVHGGKYGAGIGGGDNADGGTVTITGGTVTTYGGSESGAGIGGGYNGFGGSVNITGGTVNAYGGGTGAGIGGGAAGGAGSITINGGTVTAIGGDVEYYHVGGAGIGGGSFGAGGTVNILSGTVTATGGGDSAGIGSGMSGAAGAVTIMGGAITATGGTNGAGIGGGSGVEGGLIDIGGGSVTAYGNYGAGIGGGAFCAGGTIEISGGSMTAISSNGAGIGGGFNTNTDGGNVTITGGTINATGGIYCAGIGGCYQSAGGTVTISDGLVMATGGENGAGIGGGNGGNGGDITISGGTVTATGGANGAGIGGGEAGSGGNISISGGTVTANGGAGGGAGIGGGNYSVTGNTVISGGSVHAGSISGTLTNDGSTPVYPTAVTLPSGINIDALTVRQSTPCSYEFNGMQADGDGVLYLWLPSYAGNTTVSVTADGTTYSGYHGIVSSSATIASPNVLKMDQSALTININSSYEYGDTISPSLSGGNGSGAVTFSYTGSGSTNYSGSTAPSSLGDYTVTAAKAADNSYNATSGSESFSIVRKSMTSSMISDITGSYIYNGGEFEPAVTVSNGSTTLIEGTDYDISYSDNTDAGTAIVTVKGLGNYTGTAIKHFTIDPKTGFTVNDITGSYTYTRSGIIPPVTVKDGSMTLDESTDYRVSYSDNVNAGTATVTVTGRGNYTGTVTKHFTVSPKTGFTVDDITGSHIYTGSTIEPPVTVRDGSATLVKGTDFDVSYSDNINVGTATVTVTGRGNYTGTVSKTFTVMPKTFSVQIKDSKTGVIYDLSNATLPQGVTSVSVNSSVVTASGSSGSMYSIVSGMINISSQNRVLSMNIYDLSMADQVGNHVTGFSGTITVKIPIPNGMNGDLHVYWYNPGNDTLADMHATQQNGYLVFETTHFSYYAIAQLASRPTSNPKTGDNIPVIPLAFLGTSAAGGFIIIKKIGKWKIIKK